MEPILMMDLIPQYRRMQAEMDEAVLGVIRSGQYINGDAVRSFSDALSEYTGSEFVIPCANGTDALQIALMAFDLQPGDEVIVPAFTFIAAAEAAALLQLNLVPADVDPRTFNIDVQKLESLISPKTKVIVPVHLFGQTADMAPILSIARKYGLYVLEDNAQSIGSVYTFPDGKQQQAGTIGDSGILSFFPTKNLGCYGDGGALLTGDASFARKLRMIALHGRSQKYFHEIIGCNSRLDTLQAAVLMVKLRYLDACIQARKTSAMQYDAGLSTRIDLLETPYCIPCSTHVYNQYTLKIKNGQRDKLQKYLKEKGIPTMVYYPTPLQDQPSVGKYLKLRGDLSESDTLCRSVLSLPMHTELTAEQIRYIIKQIMNF
ncbi:MAG: DegT/DnrJ/EryC1/StrS family aminotransferase [Dysgonamonadaceae bacterium]|jgi:dTDP-4-amino-4,6-dideoxygalactose transaminase|nr:DegT/DnrJ/EryC1/StrS family aminotransferase [Dysgonamonadaceae bacterium]